MKVVEVDLLMIAAVGRIEGDVVHTDQGVDGVRVLLHQRLIIGRVIRGIWDVEIIGYCHAVPWPILFAGDWLVISEKKVGVRVEVNCLWLLFQTNCSCSRKRGS